MGAKGSLGMSVRAGCTVCPSPPPKAIPGLAAQLSALHLVPKQFPPCLSRLHVCCPLPSHSPEGARAETPWEAPAPGYQLDNNSSAVRWGGWELTAAGGLQMCGVLCWQLEHAAQTWLPKVTGLAETSFVTIFKE